MRTIVIVIGLLLMATTAFAGPVEYRQVVNTGPFVCDGYMRTIPFVVPFREIHRWEFFFGGEDGHVGDVLAYVQRYRDSALLQDFDYHNGPKYSGEVVKHPIDYGPGNWLELIPGEQLTFYYFCGTGGLGHFALSVIGR